MDYFFIMFGEYAFAPIISGGTAKTSSDWFCLSLTGGMTCQTYIHRLILISDDLESLVLRKCMLNMLTYIIL